MNLSNSGIFFLIVLAIILLYAAGVAVVMLLSRPTLRYRHVKYQDEEVYTRWIFIWFLLPLRICYEIVLWMMKVGKFLAYVIAAILTVMFSPIYFLIFRPLTHYILLFQDALKSFEKYVKFFKVGIRLGHWVMFYPEESINAEIPMRQPPMSYQGQRDFFPISIPIDADGIDMEPK